MILAFWEASSSPSLGPAGELGAQRTSQGCVLQGFRAPTPGSIHWSSSLCLEICGVNLSLTSTPCPAAYCNGSLATTVCGTWSSLYRWPEEPRASCVGPWLSLRDETAKVAWDHALRELPAELHLLLTTKDLGR